MPVSQAGAGRAARWWRATGGRHGRDSTMITDDQCPGHGFTGKLPISQPRRRRPRWPRRRRRAAGGPHTGCAGGRRISTESHGLLLDMMIRVHRDDGPARITVFTSASSCHVTPGPAGGPAPRPPAARPGQPPDRNLPGRPSQCPSRSRRGPLASQESLRLRLVPAAARRAPH